MSPGVLERHRTCRQAPPSLPATSQEGSPTIIAAPSGRAAVASCVLIGLGSIPSPRPRILEPLPQQAIGAPRPAIGREVSPPGCARAYVSSGATSRQNTSARPVRQFPSNGPCGGADPVSHSLFTRHNPQPTTALTEPLPPSTLAV